MTEPITADELRALLRDLIPIGRSDDGATTRLPWTPEDERAAAWFSARAEAVGRRVRRDPAGNLWALPDGDGPWWGVGSHLDTVVRGGCFDGALGVAAGFAVAARLPVAVVSFADEEGARFTTPTFGSRALVGGFDPALLDRTDGDGTTLREALAGAGVDPDGVAAAAGWLEHLRGFVELHIDQTRALAEAGEPAAAVAGMAARLRLQADVRGRADHAGTTFGADRHDALLAAARLIVRAADSAGPGLLVSAPRIEVEPNASTTVPEQVRLWLNARAPDAATVQAWRDGLDDGDVALTTASWSPPTTFPDDVREALGGGSLVSYAGHDAGVVAAVRPAGMVLVRNATGVSHSPEEDVDLEDAAAGANRLLRGLEALT